MERTTWNVQRGGEEVEAAWHGRRYRVSFPHQSGRPLFLTLEGLVDPPPGDAILVVTPAPRLLDLFRRRPAAVQGVVERSEEHTSELQSQSNLVCRLLLEKKKNTVRSI